MIEADSPGKLVVSGEYAVLDGAPAVSMAAGVRAIARISPAGGTAHQFCDRESGKTFDFSFGPDGDFRWADPQPGQSGRVVEHVFAALATRGSLPPGALPRRVTLDTDAFYYSNAQGRQKLGLGSSAAVLVALMAAGARWFGLVPDRDELTALCRESHRAFQGGAGSGVDVVTSVRGGVVALLCEGGTSRVESLHWPSGLRMLPVWTGTSASTPGLLARHAKFRDRDRRAFAACADRLKTCAEAALEAWREGSAQAVVETAAQCDRAMLELDRAGNIGIDTDAHRRLRALCAAHGATYKISGAGGGDFGLALAAAPEPVAALQAEFRRMELVTLTATPFAAGVTVSSN